MKLPITITVVALVLLLGVSSLLWHGVLWLFLLALLALAVVLHDLRQQRHSLRRNFPLIGRARWLMEFIRPYIRQYLMESDTDGTPVNRMFRSVVYQRAKGARDTVPFGTSFDVYREGYEWLAHSLSTGAGGQRQAVPRVRIGGRDCRQPYSASLLNISAMSFGALSPNAIRALNGGAARGGFAHNTGEGGVSPYHREHGGDLIWQIGTGYFGCRLPDGGFDQHEFASVCEDDAIRMIEIKLSQGAKPGHGGLLPAAKNTPEIAAIRGLEAYTTVHSPASHTAFSTPLELMHFIARIRELAGGKPVGFKLCIGRTSEFVALCKAMVETGISPDFITIDGGEGGSGAAPLEFTNSIGMPLRDALAFATDCLTGFGLKQDIRVIAAGRMFTAFHVARTLALGADLVYSARGMMMALGCVQSLVCNTNHCPTGVATQQPGLYGGLVVTDKSERVFRFHEDTISMLVDLAHAAGLASPSAFNRSHVYRRIDQSVVSRYDQLYPYLASGSLLDDTTMLPPMFELALRESSAQSFQPITPMARFQHGLAAFEARDRAV